LASLRDLGKELYPHLPVFAQEALLTGHFYAKSRRLYGSSFQQRLAALQESEHFDAERLYALQCTGVRRVVQAAAHTSYYQELFRELSIRTDDLRTPEDLRRLPLLEKETVRQAPERFVDERLERRHLRVAYTSGTSGTPLRIYFTTDFEAEEEAFLARQWRWVGFRRGDRRVRLRGDLVASVDRQATKPWRRNFADRELRMSAYHLSTETARAYVERIKAFGPRALIAYPSSAAILAAFVRDQSWHCTVPLVFTSSETLSARQRDLIETTFGAQVLDHYGLTESTVAIQECEQGSYHVIPEYGVTELVPIATDASAGLCEIISTGLVNKAMPLIRYRTGDYVRRRVDARCPCDRAFPVVQEIIGRQDDVVVSASGARVGRLDHVFKGLTDLVESQIVQEPDRRIRVRVVPGRGYNQRTAEALARNLRERVGNLPIEVEAVTAIPRGANGKFRAVLSHVDHMEAGVP
jgi:phenylacetate-CoA ligase